MADTKLILMGGGVFAAVFVGTLAAFGLGGPFARAVGKIPAGDEAVLTPLQPTLESPFHKVDASKITPKDTADTIQHNDVAMAIVGYKMHGETPPEALIQAAEYDAPKQQDYVNYVAIDRIDRPTEEDKDFPRDARIACFAKADAYHTVHTLMRYDATRVWDMSEADLYSWVMSGCAQAMKSGGRMLNAVQYKTTLRSLLPDTPDYAEQRRQLLADLNTKPRTEER